MFNKNDFFIYSSYGVCQIDDICDKKLNGENRTYYVFHPVTDKEARIMIPVDSKKVFMRPLIPKQEAAEIMEAFMHEETIPWIDNKKLREKVFMEMIKTGKLSEISKVVKVLMQKQLESQTSDKKFPDSDRRLLQTIKQSFCIELAIVYQTTPQCISERLCIEDM